MNGVVNLSRRSFLSKSGALGGFILGVQWWPAVEAASNGDAAVFRPDAFIRIGSDDSITIVVGRSEMGQGVFTSLPMLIAEELDADWNRVSVEAAPVAPAYDNPVFKMQGTGGSCSVTSSWEPLRKAGASARAMLIEAAAAEWGVAVDECDTGNSRVHHRASGRNLSFGQLAPRASQLEPPAAVTLKDPSRYRLIGQPLPRLDIPDKTNGRARFGIDVNLPGMLTAVVLRPPVFGSTPRNVNTGKALAIAGVRHVSIIDAGVAVVAEDFWSASKGRDALEVEWQETPFATFDDASQRNQYEKLTREPGPLAAESGDAAAALQRSAKRIEAHYEFPYLTHVTMEPLNCVADVRADRCEVWVGTQFQTYDRNFAAQAAGLRPEQVQLHSMLMGGGFGRRGIPDGHFVREAVQISKAVQAPVKVIWTRSDDIRGGYYRPAYHHRVTAGLSDNGELLAWSQRVVGQSVLAGTQWAAADGIDRSSFNDPFYRLPDKRIELHTTRFAIPVWAWRSVGSTHGAFVIECFMDELAHAAGKDPLDFRRPLLDEQRRAVLELAAEKANWGSPLSAGRARGFAMHQYDSMVAQVAEVSVAGSGEIRVHRIVCAIDCGTVVNPDTVRAQMEGGIAMGLSAALHERISFERGQVRQSNFSDYPILRMNEMPQIEVYIVPSTARPRGVGEAGPPPVAPAVANAIFAATGRRIRRLPML